MEYRFSAHERFLRYVTIDTQSDPNSLSIPSTEKQKDLSRLLAHELRDLGASDVDLSPSGCVYATIPATSTKNVPTLCFCAHIDTAPDCSGFEVRPIVHRNYQGGDLLLPDNGGQIISPLAYPHLQSMIGHDIISASGGTLLGADDKAGIAEIVDFAHYLLANSQVKHGKIRLLFTTDEEVGRGTENVDMPKLSADFGYTLDGGALGAIEDQTFSADGVVVTIQGVISHPGYAKGKLVNALKIAGELLAALPKEKLSPETTDKMDGFIHPTGVEGIAERCTVNFIIRDFETSGLTLKERFLEDLVLNIVKKYPGASYEFKVKEQYRNMKEVLNQHPEVVKNAEMAVRRAGIEPTLQSIRGGTDGSRLSFMGMPCANLFAGQQAIHSKHEHISVQDMQKAVEVLVHLVQIWEENSPP